LPGSFFCAAIFIVDDVNRFPDGMDKDWDEGQISSLLASAFAPED
jgi:N-acetylglucosaminylphosphatidylinositol deacetylase